MAYEFSSEISVHVCFEVRAFEMTAKSGTNFLNYFFKADGVVVFVGNDKITRSRFQFYHRVSPPDTYNSSSFSGRQKSAKIYILQRKSFELGNSKNSELKFVSSFSFYFSKKKGTSRCIFFSKGISC